MDKTKLVKLLNLTASDQDGEALAAVRIATKIIKEAGLTWEQIISGDLKNYKTTEVKREYGRGYRAGFKKGAAEASRPRVVVRPRPMGNMVHDVSRVSDLIQRIMSSWDKLEPTQKHYVNNSLEFLRINKCLPVSNYDELMRISKTMWGRY